MADLRVAPAYFDAGLGGWVLSRYADVSAALREPLLEVPGTGGGADVAHRTVREAAAQVLSAERLGALCAEAEASARRLCGSLAADSHVDLVREMAEPWSLALAAAATGASPADAEALSRMAREVFLVAACATGPEARAEGAALELARGLQGAGASLTVQAFVALSQSLPGFLAGAWLELFRHPAEVRHLRADPASLPRALEELLRRAGPARAVFRRARAEVRIGCARIRAGELAILMLAAANHDPERYPAPHRLDFRRGANGHLAFGSGVHACSGTRLIRRAAAAATRALLDSTIAVEVLGPVEWIGGFAIRVPATLPVVLRRSAAAGAGVADRE